MSTGDTTAPMRGHPDNRLLLCDREEIRMAVSYLAEAMIALGEPDLAEVCWRAIEGHRTAQVQAGSVLASALRLLRPTMARGSET